MPHEVSEKIRSWIPPEEIDGNTLNQLYNLSKMDFVSPHIAVMPDVHLGKGAAVGSVIPTDGAIMPAAVGVDIGCGMIAIQTNLMLEDMPESLKSLRRGISEVIPLGVGRGNTDSGQQKSSRTQRELRYLVDLAGERVRHYNEVDKNWSKQFGSLGSGNHFIEVVVDETDSVWAFLHSGSRGIGNKLAMRHIQVAEKQMEEQGVKLVDRDLSYLTEGTQEFDDYITDLLWAQEFALRNRREMMARVLEVLRKELGNQVQELQRVECHHNFTQREVHFGKDVWLSRKGAIMADDGRQGLIPGSMGTSSYVVRGKGNEESFNSAPHGAGRRMSRGQARREFTLEDFDKQMSGIEAARDKAFLDELPGAYKDIESVMTHSGDLVGIVHGFKQLVNVKGQ